MVVGQESSATMFDRGSEMKAIGNLETEMRGGANPSGPLTNSCRQRQNANRRTRKESLIIGDNSRISSSERSG